jgi:hypothetical protein
MGRNACRGWLRRGRGKSLVLLSLSKGGCPVPRRPKTKQPGPLKGHPFNIQLVPLR